MALRWLGERFDIHTGGIDNVFPHHEDEIAQSAPLVGGPPATHWVHGEHLLMRGRKMAKSAGNFERITDLADDGIDPLAFRYLTLTSRYGRKLNYSEESLGAAAAALGSLRDRVRAMGPAPSDGPWTAPQPLRGATAQDRPLGLIEGPLGHGAEESIAPELTDRARTPIARLSDEGADLHRRFVEAIDADLDLPAALAVVREIARSGLPDDERRWLVLDADFVLGLDLDQVWSSTPAASDGEDLSPELAALLDERSAARRARDFARADSLRDELRANGVEVVDEPGGGTSYRRVARG
jgi:cysteinyl-tRNA synthetase